jgi:subtilisin family serine protease
MKFSSIVRLGLGAVALGTLLQACASGQDGHEDVAKGSNGLQALMSNSKVQPALAAGLQAAPAVRAIVTFHPPELDLPRAKQYGHADRALALRAIQDTGAKVLAAVPHAKVHHRFQAVNAVALSLDAAAVETLRNLPDVESVVLDQSGSANLLEAVPLSRLDVVQAAGFIGTGVTVAIVDTGVNRTHVDLADSLVAEACFCSGSSQGDGTGCCPNGQETQQGSGAASDDNGHGTNVTGIVTSNGTSAPKGGAPGAKIVAVKVLDAAGNFNFSSDVIAGLDWLISNRPDVKVVNASLGTFAMFPGACDSDSSATPWKTAIDTLRANGVLFFASSGNQSSSTSMALPACVANTVALGAVWDSNVGPQTIFCNEATTAADKITCFTNSDSALDLLAPGAPMTSTGLGSTTATSTYYGTSQASPLAAACAALLLQKDPSLTPARIEQALKASPKRITDTRNGLTFPRLDCGAALASLDTTCTSESNAAFCSRLGKNCGSVTAADNCGQTRTVTSCGSCTSPQTCGGGGTANVCGATSCTPESNAAFCSRLSKNCGSVTAVDNCGQTRTVTSCGSCTSPQTCGGAGTANVCGGGASTPCSGLCSSPTQFTGPSYSSGNLGTAATCSQTTANLSGANCGQFASSRTFRVNNVLVTCNGGNFTLPAKRNGGYCFQASAGDFPWAYYTTW